MGPRGSFLIDLSRYQACASRQNFFEAAEDVTLPEPGGERGKRHVRQFGEVRDEQAVRDDLSAERKCEAEGQADVVSTSSVCRS